jgi:hypothetical protein
MRRAAILVAGVASLAGCDINFVGPGDLGPQALVLFSAEETDSLRIQLSVSLVAVTGSVRFNGVTVPLEDVGSDGSHQYRLALSWPPSGLETAPVLELPGAAGMPVIVSLPVLSRAGDRIVSAGSEEDVRLAFAFETVPGFQAVGWDLRFYTSQGSAEGRRVFQASGPGAPPNPLRVPCEWVRPLSQSRSTAQLTLQYQVEPLAVPYRVRIGGTTGSSWELIC